MTIWVLRKNDQNHVIRPKFKSKSDDFSQRENSKTASFMNHITPNFFQTTADEIEKEESGIRRRKLYNLLRTKHGFNLFMMHLSVELRFV